MPWCVSCGPNEALIVSGCCHGRPHIVNGGRVFIWPGIQKVQRISLNTLTLTIESPHVYTNNGVPVSVTGVAQVKVEGRNADMLRNACQQFLGKTEQEIINIMRETMEGHQRMVIANNSVEDIYKVRKKFSRTVFDSASTDLVSMGFTVVSYTIKDISDDEEYLKSLGLARTAEVKKDARIGEAKARKEAAVAEAKAEEERMEQKYKNDMAIAKALFGFEKKKAEFDKEVSSKEAITKLAYDLQAAHTRVKIVEEMMKTRKIEKEKEVEIQEEEQKRMVKELEATIKEPAKAEKYKIEELSKSLKEKIQLEAEAEAFAIREKAKAEAEIIELKAQAEAEQLAKKADAFKTYEHASKVEMMLEYLPKFAAECAAPLAQTERIKLISTGDGPIGASRMVGEVLEIMNNTFHTVFKMAEIERTENIRQPGSSQATRSLSRYAASLGSTH
ncbi:flotillin-1 [Brevipalpus obovatus]|uniref:flotillin-1 n=1 Tax=Brevipalpus obovatus TaxID=246614 RepID=UPI003D9EA119